MLEGYDRTEVAKAWAEGLRDLGSKALEEHLRAQALCYELDTEETEALVEEGLRLWGDQSS